MTSDWISTISFTFSRRKRLALHETSWTGEMLFSRIWKRVLFQFIIFKSVISFDWCLLCVINVISTYLKKFFLKSSHTVEFHVAPVLYVG